ncbi:unnamed protein product [Staurois parvus]|uniref:Uncharacterized protein n=1 Tax=Staurois parvus TaxID=386267 RepID=A0ABN9BSX6_9NEOB|nr:unnamed protein product [Staurois parvus]
MGGTGGWHCWAQVGWHRWAQVGALLGTGRRTAGHRYVHCWAQGAEPVCDTAGH